MLGFGGPVIYVVEVDVKCSEIWDLTGDVVSKMARRGIELLLAGRGCVEARGDTPTMERRAQNPWATGGGCTTPMSPVVVFAGSTWEEIVCLRTR